MLKGHAVEDVRSDDEGEGFRDADVIARQTMEAECFLALASLSRWTL